MTKQKPTKKYKNWKSLSGRKTKSILQAYNRGVHRNDIKRIYKITDGQLTGIIRDKAR